jgi:glutamine amidotransferase
VLSEPSVLAVVDYGMGNVRSVLNALDAIGTLATLAATPEALDKADRIILPGVGAFSEAMDRLRERSLIESLHENVMVRKKPFLGVCLGMQLVADVSFEHGEHRGLGWISGEVRRIEPAGALRVPHVGWNTMVPDRSRLVSSRADFYFVHAYHVVPNDPCVVTGTCAYGGSVTSMIERQNIFGTQFHPEKSQQAGLALLRTFVGLVC